MEQYLFKSTAILATLFAFYKLFLENTSVHNFKRFYLFGSLLASFFIPFIIFTIYVEPSPFIKAYTEESKQLIFNKVVEPINYWPFVLWVVYGLGILFFSVKFSRNLFSLIQQIHKNPTYRNSKFVYVLLKNAVIPHTFFSYIFLNKHQFENDEIPREVMLHEQTHAIQKHSLDVIVVEFLQIVFWFNPLYYFLKRSIKLNHEFLADRAVLNAGTETREYQKILLAFSSNAFTPALAHSINYLSIKKRFTVMKTRTTKRTIWFRSLLILPLLSLLIYGFGTKEIIQKPTNTTELRKEKATKPEMVEYNNLAKKYNTVAIENRIIPMKDLERLEKINKKMTGEQKANAQPFPECLPPKPKVQKEPLETGNLYMAPEAPPAPHPDPVEYLKELAKRGALFYIGPHKYTPEEAIELVKKSTNDVTIDVSKYPIVNLGGC